MTAGQRDILDGSAFDHLFPKPTGRDESVKKEALLADTLGTIKRVIDQTLWQTKAIANKLKAGSVRSTCKNIWDFCYKYIQYKEDKPRTEQIRTPRRAWYDRERGIDCDCFTVLIGSILTNLGIPFVMRLWRHKASTFEHIYPVAFTPKGREVIIDCVIDQFDQQAPYTEIKDIEMELQVLDGVDKTRYNEFGDQVFYETDLPIDAEDLNLDAEYLEGLAGKAEREARRAKRKAKRTARREKRKTTPLKERIEQKVKNFGQKLKKVNPATALLRAGILASMKLNVLQVGSKLRFAYWTPQEARSRNMDMAKYNQIQQVRAKIENIYHKLGGDKNALRKAVLEGRGNRNRMVRLNGPGWGTITVTENASLRDVLGEDIIATDLAESGILEQGINGLGSVTLSAAIAAAAGFIGKIAGMFKKIGGFFKKGSREDSQFQIQQNTEAEEEKRSRFSVDNLKNLVKRQVNAAQIMNNRTPIDPNAPSSLPENPSTDAFDEDIYSDDNYNSASRDGASGEEIENEPIEDLETIDTTELEDDDSSGNKETPAGGGIGTWIKEHPIATGGIALGTLGLIFLGVKMAQKKKASLNGVSGVKKKKKKKPVSVRKKTTSRPKRRKKPIKRKQSTPGITRVEL